MTVDITGLDRAAVLQALYNYARPQGMGHLHPKSRDSLQRGEAEELVGGRDYFDYVHGRVIKVRLQEGATRFNAALYDRDNGPGAAASAIAALRESQ